VDFSCESGGDRASGGGYDSRATARPRRPQPGDIYIYNASMGVSKLLTPVAVDKAATHRLVLEPAAR
jgi:hypothetical protein